MSCCLEQFDFKQFKEMWQEVIWTEKATLYLEEESIQWRLNCCHFYDCRDPTNYLVPTWLVLSCSEKWYCIRGPAWVSEIRDAIVMAAGKSLPKGNLCLLVLWINFTPLSLQSITLSINSLKIHTEPIVFSSIENLLGMECLLVNILTGYRYLHSVCHLRDLLT